MIQEILIFTLAAFAAYIYYALRKIKHMTDMIKNRERVYYIRVVISAKDQKDLYSIPYQPFRSTIIVVSKADELVEKINDHFKITDQQNVFIEHLAVLN